MYRIFPCSLAAATLLLFVPHAHANIWDWLWGSDQAPELASDIPGFCDSYADDAVSAAAANTSNACERSGPRYSTDRNVHYWWCMGSRTSSVAAEDTNRGAEMDKCTYCRLYADKVPAKVREARLYSCQVTGPKWSSDPQDHFRWCFDSKDSLDIAASEERDRDVEVALCKDRYTTAQLAACEAYADKAVEQAKSNARLKCGNTGPQWSQDRDAHFAFCTSTTRTNPNGVGDVTASQQGARDKRNNFCALATVRRKNLETTTTTKQLRSGASGKSGASTAIGAAKPTTPAASNAAIDRLSGNSQLPSASGQPKAQDAGRLRAPASAATGAPAETRPSSSATPELFRQGPITAPPPKPVR